MNIVIDNITRKKLALVKNLYLKAETDSKYIYNLSNRIITIIECDLTIKTLLKAICSVSEDQASLPEQFSGLLQNSEVVLKKFGIEKLPYKRWISYLHSIRNDAQHKAKYPNESDVMDSISTLKCFCDEIFEDVWNCIFDEFSMTDYIDDILIRKLLVISRQSIKEADYIKSLAFAGTAFQKASKCLFSLMPETGYGVTSMGYHANSEINITHLNSVLKNIEKSSKHYAAMISTGVNPVEYKKMLSYTPTVTFIYDEERATETNQRFYIEVNAIKKNISYENADWANSYVSNTIFRWQEMGIAPVIEKEEEVERLNKLIEWNNNNIFIKK